MDTHSHTWPHTHTHGMWAVGDGHHSQNRLSSTDQLSKGLEWDGVPILHLHNSIFNNSGSLGHPSSLSWMPSTIQLHTISIKLRSGKFGDHDSRRSNSRVCLVIWVWVFLSCLVHGGSECTTVISTPWSHPSHPQSRCSRRCWHRVVCGSHRLWRYCAVRNYLRQFCWCQDGGD